jgi:hypothetical protein
MVSAFINNEKKKYSFAVLRHNLEKIASDFFKNADNKNKGFQTSGGVLKLKKYIKGVI